MKRGILGCLLISLVAGCSVDKQRHIYPKHIEAPDYPLPARTANIIGKITLAVTIDADGNVKNVEATTDNPVQRAHPLLQGYAVENMKHWTFVKPPYSPFTQTIVYDYEFDPALSPEGGPSSLPEITKVNFDLPDRVAILANQRIIDVSQSATRD
jgi:TonB family protein